MVWPRLPWRSFSFRLGLVALAGVTLRVAYLADQRSLPPSADGLVYSLAGGFFGDGQGFRNGFTGGPTALHPPGWTAVLGVPSAVGWDSIWSHQVVSALIGTITVVLLGLVGREVGGPRVGLVAAGLAAVHPELWLWERELASEVLLLPLSALVVLLAYRHLRSPGLGGAALLGLVVGLLTLTRSEQALIMVVLVAPVIALGGLGSWPRRASALLLAGVCAVAVTVPWLVYNHDRFVEPTYFTTGTGLTLRYANNPVTFDGPRLGYGDPEVFHDFRLLDESQTDPQDRRVALSFARDHATRLPAVVLAREGRTWGLYRPSQQIGFDQDWGHSARWVYGAGLVFYWASVPFSVLGAMALRRRGVPLLPLLAPIVVVVVYVALTYGQTRYRVTADAVLVVLAAVGLDALWRRARATWRDTSAGRGQGSFGPNA